mmetsp:Transcript_18144/g.49522  ORF Transcript_18144/g.49522 Transcript_18144/m.49522 type:complete len:105 (-) Transcript_18144:186-500(-)|eukprot:CAMPEP_0168741272 /NCGR_PEP_ID=MMETSP0724-20121128/12421_1 /TAXON_ID=265536 /ORGANISM="Amphiprora sp., Strain CCMP467" /LENGTH=104 /DNA_ID=CAMNT_0008788757 /DNA_START=116 /DNA_END=430 /DNA_ORIENTATION=+
MKLPLFLASLLFCLSLSLDSIHAFTPASVSSSSKAAATSTQLFFFGQPKDDGSPGDYLCPDCGYVFTKGPKEWAKLSADYSCPPCGAPKRRFKKIPKGSAKGGR